MVSCFVTKWHYSITEEAARPLREENRPALSIQHAERLLPSLEFTFQKFFQGSFSHLPASDILGFRNSIVKVIMVTSRVLKLIQPEV